MLDHRSLTRFNTVEFPLEVEGARVRCLVTVEALKQHFGATDDSAGVVLLRNLPRIREVAAEVARRSGPSESIVVRSADFH
jgi:hypothetical protein